MTDINWKPNDSVNPHTESPNSIVLVQMANGKYATGELRNFVFSVSSQPEIKPLRVIRYAIVEFRHEN